MSASALSDAAEVRTLLGLLDSQLRILERWSQRGERFVQALVTRTPDDASVLQRFLDDRDNLLKALTLYDRKIAETVPTIPQADRTRALSQAVEARLNRCQLLIAQTTSQDDQILQALTSRVSELAHDAANTQRSRQILAKFKSQQKPDSGEEVDSQL